MYFVLLCASINVSLIIILLPILEVRLPLCTLFQFLCPMRNISGKLSFEEKNIVSLIIIVNRTLFIILSIVSGPGMTPSLASHCLIYFILLTISEGNDWMRNGSDVTV